MVSGPLGAPEHRHLRLLTPSPFLSLSLHRLTPLCITSFDTPKACCGCLCLWAPGACSLYTVRGCKSGCHHCQDQSWLVPPPSKFNSVLSLSLSLAVALSNTAANTKHPGIADSKLAPGLKKKEKKKTTHIHRHLHTDSAQQQNINEGL